MSPLIGLPLSVLAAYLIGSFPTSFVMAKLIKGVDIRRHGSGNVGATNVYRVVGKIPGFIVLVVDISKGVLAASLLPAVFLMAAKEIDYDFFRVLLGFAAIAGHIWTPFLRFKGGKGVATTIGVMIIAAPFALALSLLTWLAVFSFSRYVSLASIAMCVALPVFAALLGGPFWIILFTILSASLLIYKHKENIRRLVKGEEPKTT